MGLCGITNEIKEDFGKRLRAARDARGLSRQVLSARLGVSPKTVQSWEMGRTFIEKLSLFPLIERELGISIAQIIEEAMLPETTNTKRVAEPQAAYGSNKQDNEEDQPLTFGYSQVKASIEFSAESSDKFAAIPVIKADSLGKEVHDLTESDVINHTVISREWVPRGGLMIAFKAEDNGLEPTVPANSIVVIDRRPVNLDKIYGKNVAVIQKNKALKLRKIEEGKNKNSFRAVPANGKSRGSFELKFDKGDRILGKIIAVFSPC